jgi:hypothetical protein
MKFSTFLGFIAVMMVITEVQARPKHIEGVYSDIAMSEYTGDIVGRELRIFPIGREEYAGVVQIADGDHPDSPQLVKINVTKNRIKINIPSWGKWSGYFKGKNIFLCPDGHTDKDDCSILKYGVSYWGKK